MAEKHSEKIIEGRQLSYRYTLYDDAGNPAEERTALEDVDLDVEPGQFIAILGHNGSGKSTLARHLNALLIPDDGTLYVDGYDTRDAENVWKIRQSAGMVFQNPDNQIIASVVEEDVGFGPENLGVPTKEIWQRVEEALKAVGMWKMRASSPNRLSGGQKQRVAIAGVIAMRPKCIVLDEPTAMLDPQGRKDVISTITRLCRENHMTVVLITHHMDECVNADKVIVLSAGSVAASGTPQEVFSDIALMEEQGLSSPETVKILYDLNRKGFSFPLTTLGVDACAQMIADALESR